MRVLLRDAQAEAQTALRRTTAQPRHDPYQQLGERVASVIREADQVAETIKTEAHRDAELVTRDARAEADRIRTDAQAKAEDARSQAETAVRAAREEADRTIAGLSTRRDALVDQLASMQERLIGVARDLESAMDVQVTIPDFASIKDLREESAERDGSSAGEDDPTTAAETAFEGSAQDDADRAGREREVADRRRYARGRARGIRRSRTDDRAWVRPKTSRTTTARASSTPRTRSCGRGPTR